MTPQETLKATVERLIEKIESNTTGKWIKPFNSSFPSNGSTKTEYQGINILNLWAIAEERNYSSNQWFTFNQLKALKAHIKQGEKASPVFFFKPIEVTETDEATGEEVTKNIFMLKVYSVFNRSQTTLPEEADNNEEILDIEEFIARTNVTLKNSVEGAYYVPKMDYIGIPSKRNFKSSELYYATICHELGHWTGHESRMNRDLEGRMNGNENEVKSYAIEELTAETIRSFLQVKFGLATTEMEEQNAAYLKGWLKPLKEDPKMLWKIFSEASKAYNYLLEITKEEEAAA